LTEIDGNKILGSINNYDTLIELLRKRQSDLGIAMETVDAVAGLPLRYTSKLLAKVPVRQLGRVSFGPLLKCLGMTLIAVEDLSALKRIESRLTKRQRAPSDAGSPMLAQKRRKRRGFSAFRRSHEFAKLMRARQILQQSPSERSAIAHKAALARWNRHKQ